MWSIVLYYNNRDGTIMFVDGYRKDKNFIYFYGSGNNKLMESFESSLSEQKNKYDKVLSAYTQINNSIQLELEQNDDISYMLLLSITLWQMCTIIYYIFK